MAKTVITTLTDDLDGSKAEQTVVFAYDGKSYEIDLSKKNAAAFEKSLAPYVSAGRRVTTTRKSGRPASSGLDLTAIRTWARRNGYEVSDRGRVPLAVIEAYGGQ